MEQKGNCDCKAEHTLSLLREEFQFYLDLKEKNVSEVLDYFMDRGPVASLNVELDIQAKLCQKMINLINYLESEENKHV